MDFSKKMTFWQGFVLTFRLTPAHSALWILHKAGNALKQAVNVLLTAYFINTAIAILQDQRPYSDILMPLLGLLLYLSWDYVIGPLMDFVYKNMDIKLRLRLRVPFTEKRARLEYSHVEDPKVWDMVSRTWENPETKLKELTDSVLSLSEMLISTASVLIILITEVWWAGLLIVTVSAPLLIIASKSGKKSYDAQKDMSKVTRKYGFLTTMLTSREAALERNLFGYTNKINKLYRLEYEFARKYENKISIKWFIRAKAVGLAASAASAFVLFILIPSAINQTISIGLFISLTSALFSSINWLSWSVPYQLENISKGREYVKDVNEFFALSEQNDADCMPSVVPLAFESVEFKDVTFTYPNTEKLILDGFSMKMEKGKHYSFVGVNGAGKTTITKLMTRLYDGYSGEILLNGRDIRTYPMEEIKAVFSAVFQDFARYQISVADNIGLGKVHGASESEINDAVEMIGLTEAIGKLANGLDTTLGKIKDDGVDLSGGEWQRVAMARAIINPAPVKILDEPTAALDPIGESRLYEKFEQISKGYTTVFISHRLGSTKLADVIFVVDGGKVTEIGSHEDLMEKGGVYAEMFESQRSWYA